MYFVYILRDEVGRHYIGMTANVEIRLQQHRSGGTQTTRRTKGELALVASASVPSKHEALVLERKLKGWKNPAKAIEFLQSL